MTNLKSEILFNRALLWMVLAWMTHDRPSHIAVVYLVCALINFLESWMEAESD